MSETSKTCPVCHGLGFVSHKDSDLQPEFNVFGLHRVIHESGEVTWEGECRVCHGAGEVKS